MTVQFPATDHALSKKFHLRLDVGHLAPAELELVEGNVGLPEVPEEAKLFRPEDQERVPLAALPAGRSADTVDVLLGIVWGVELQFGEERFCQKESKSEYRNYHSCTY